MLVRIIDWFGITRGFTFSSVSFIFGSILGIGEHVQNLITFYFQLLAFLVAIGAGIFTIINGYCRLKDRKERKQDEQQENSDVPGNEKSG